MKVQDFINQYGNHIQSYKEYDNGVIRFKFDTSKDVMWMKRMVSEKLDLSVKTASVPTKTYWFH